VLESDHNLEIPSTWSFLTRECLTWFINRYSVAAAGQ
jgi:hypothetical protein